MSKHVKLKVPEGKGGIVHEGTLHIAHDGVVDAPEDLVDAFKAQGCVEHTPAPPVLATEVDVTEDPSAN